MASLPGYAFLQGPATSLVRPHPGFWRVIHGVVVIYLLILVFLLFQNVDDARLYLKVAPPHGRHVQVPAILGGSQLQSHGRHVQVSAILGGVSYNRHSNGIHAAAAWV